MQKRKQDTNMETSASLTPDLEGATRSICHPHRYAGLEKSILLDRKIKENKRKQEKNRDIKE